MFSTKQKVIRKFNEKARTYSQSAIMQNQIAAKLSQHLGMDTYNSILEVGCGTGFLTEHLIKQFPDASLLITDASPAMVAECKQSVSPHQNIQFACMDGESLASNQLYDLIISSMTLHWFMDLQRACIDITNQLKRGGEFIFSILGENSFHEWHTICRIFKLPIATPIFPAEHLLATMLPNVELTVETYQQTYQSTYDFLRSLKNIGAIAPRRGYQSLSSSQLRNVLRYFHSEIVISYEVIYGKYKRK